MSISFNLHRTSRTRRGAQLIAAVSGLLGLGALHQTVRGADEAPKWVELKPADQELFDKTHAIFEQSCLSCHGPQKQRAKLRLDTREAIFKGGESGPAIVENDPTKSLLAQVLHYKGDIQMPPKAKLPDDQIATVEAWIKAGAPWPEAAKTEAAKTKVPAPEVKAPKSDDKAAKTVKLDPQVAEFFETKVRPVLAENCFSCHGATKQMASLRLDSRAAVLKGSDSGPVVVPGDPDKSTLIAAIRHIGKVKMPAGRDKLKLEDIEALAQWVKMGVPWPGDAAAAPTATTVNGEYVISPEMRRFWSFSPVKNYAPPKVKTATWVASPIDNFVLSKLEKRGLSPSVGANKRTLIRRATYDLHGLLPTPNEVEAFVNDKAPDAWEKVVNRLLASPRYGERWGRHWLDVARYADTKGYVFEEDRNYPHAYNYRDWVIRAFNEDLPYDQFIVQQLAADRLPLGDDKRALAAMGFLRVGRRFLNQEQDIIDDRIDTTMRGFQGLSTACARCHDHKFDPIPTKDYYSLYGVFASSVEPPPQPISPLAISLPYAAHEQKVREAEGEREGTIRAQVNRLREMVKKNEPLPEAVKSTLAGFREDTLPNGDQMGKIEASFEPAARDKIKLLDGSLQGLKRSYPPVPEMAMTMADAPEPRVQHVFRRGNPGNWGDEVPRRFHAILATGERPIWDKGSGRLELAQAIASPSNPLTARVMVNRIWLHHFGSGLVRTPSDFGTRGDKPTHPELLDYLAKKFVEGGWSIKKMHRLIMMSNTYRQSNDYNPKYFAADPENTLLWRMNRRRMELEALRDSLLLTSGQLDAKIGGPSVNLWQAPFPLRRTVYGQIERQNLPGIFRTFDFAGPDASSPQRFRTTVPQQALFLMNSPFVVEQAQKLAAHPDLTKRKDVASRVRYLYYRLFSRAPEADELALGVKFLNFRTPSQKIEESKDVWSYGYGAYDEATKRVASFAPLSVFKNDGYQGGAEFPDAKLSWLRLTATGGHTGRDAQHSVIRRWTAPNDGVIAIKGTINHPGEAGDGVEARIVSSREGTLGVWPVHHAQAETVVQKATVKKGDTIDFVTACRADETTDSFTWSSEIRLENGERAWNSNAQFKGPAAPAPPPLDNLSRYVQALMMTNEFFFVD